MEKDVNVIEMMKEKGTKGLRIIKFGFLLFIAFVVVLMLNPFVVIGAGERGVVLNFGAVQPNVLGEGLHFRGPIVQRIMKLDVKVHKEQVDRRNK
jgi:regulator of protease activity HflC (stomatin/prohibitin superfamily)